MRVIALSKDSTVLLRRKIRVVIDVRSGKLDFSREKNHGCSLISPIRKLRRSTPGLSIGFFHLHGSGRTPRARLHTAPRQVRNSRWRKRGNGYERDRGRSWFGGQSGAKLPGKAGRDTSVRRRSAGAESRGWLTPSRGQPPVADHPSSDKDSFSNPATSLGTSGTFLLEQCRCRSRTRYDGRRPSRAWRGPRLPAPPRRRRCGRQWRRTHRGASSETGRLRQQQVSLGHSLGRTKNASPASSRHKESGTSRTTYR